VSVVLPSDPPAASRVIGGQTPRSSRCRRLGGARGAASSTGPCPNSPTSAAALVPTFADGFDLASDSAAMWTTMSRDDGHRLLHLLIRYIVDRRDNENRWVQALEKTDVPLNFVWGMRDPISGAHMAERISRACASRPSRGPS
jgi:pimeloyl-ACP methyl ester carboxylesterase